MSEIWKKFDERLFSLKLTEPSLQMHKEVVASHRKIHFEWSRTGRGPHGLYLELIDGDMVILRKYLEVVDQLCRDVWLIQGNRITPEFVRAMPSGIVGAMIETRVGVTKGYIENLAGRMNYRETDLYPHRHHLALATNQLKGAVANRYEVEARELEYKNGQSSRSLPERGAAGPEDVPNVRRVTQAPTPPTHVGGLGLTSATSKPTQVVEDLPPYYPNDLKPQTRLILREAVRKFPSRTYVLDLCQYIVSELTQHFSGAIQGKTLRADQVEDTMNEVLHYVLVHNSDNSDDSFRIKQIVRKSDEWLKLSKEVVRAAADADKNLARAYDPTLSPPILQEWKAFKAIKQIITGPREYIPEVFLRGSISRQLGIKPEDVTWKQIIYAVTELFPYYPAITVIPSVEANDLAPTEQSQGRGQRTGNASSEESSNVENGGDSNERKSFVLPVLAKKGWSIHGWATESEVDFHTASDYLKCKTNPYRSTRKKLADSLGIPVEDLPR